MMAPAERVETVIAAGEVHGMAMVPATVMAATAMTAAVVAVTASH